MGHRTWPREKRKHARDHVWALPLIVPSATSGTRQRGTCGSVWTPPRARGTRPLISTCALTGASIAPAEFTASMSAVPQPASVLRCVPQNPRCARSSCARRPFSTRCARRQRRRPTPACCWEAVYSASAPGPSSRAPELEPRAGKLLVCGPVSISASPSSGCRSG